MDWVIIKNLIEEFINGNYKFSVKKSLMEKERNQKHIYNEFSFQHELGIFLRERLKKTHNIQFERNIKDFGYKKNAFCKSEIDIVLLGKENNCNYLIELKYHTLDETRYHDTTADCVKDIRFVYDVIFDYKDKIEDKKTYLKFNKGFCVTVVEDKKFYTRTNREKSFNYYCFRNIEKVFDKKVTYSGKNKNKIIKNVDELIEKGYLPIRSGIKNNTGWIDIYNDAKYYLVEI